VSEGVATRRDSCHTLACLACHPLVQYMWGMCRFVVAGAPLLQQALLGCCWLLGTQYLQLSPAGPSCLQAVGQPHLVRRRYLFGQQYEVGGFQALLLVAVPRSGLLQATSN
jgi:hypothetical protein